MNSSPVTFTVSGTGFASELEGVPFKVAIVDVDGKKVIDTADGFVTNGKITATIEADPDTTYRADLFIDTDRDGKCQFGIDSVYAVDIQKQGGGSTKAVNVMPSLVDSRGCLAWGGSTLHATLTNFDDSGTIFKAVLIRMDGEKKLQLKSDAVSGSTITIDFPGAIVPGHFYEVHIYIDDTHNDACDTGADGVYMKTSTALPPGQTDGLTGDVVPLAIDGQVNAITSCAAFQ